MEFLTNFLWKLKQRDKVLDHFSYYMTNCHSYPSSCWDFLHCFLLLQIRTPFCFTFYANFLQNTRFLTKNVNYRDQFNFKPQNFFFPGRNTSIGKRISQIGSVFAEKIASLTTTTTTTTPLIWSQVNDAPRASLIKKNFSMLSSSLLLTWPVTTQQYGPYCDYLSAKYCKSRTESAPNADLMLMYSWKSGLM